MTKCDARRLSKQSSGAARLAAEASVRTGSEQ